jgi:kumamolisin
MRLRRLSTISTFVSFAAIFVLVSLTVSAAQTQEAVNANTAGMAQSGLPHGRVMTPASSIARGSDKGVRAHTHLQIFVPEEAVTPFAGPPFAGFGFETPASLACVYNLVPKASACNPNLFKANPAGGFGAIAVVDAFHYPTALADLQTFSTQFGLKAPNLSVVFAGGTRPAQDPTGGWELEAALDLQWAHAMAPDAKLILVEAASDSLNSLLAAEAVASQRVVAAGGGEVSNSWGTDEFAGDYLRLRVYDSWGGLFLFFRRSTGSSVSGGLSERGGRGRNHHCPQSLERKLPD